MQANHIREPVGYETDDIVLSWKVVAIGEMKRHSRIQVALDSKFENIIFDSGDDPTIEGIGFVLPIATECRKRYYWKAIVQSIDGNVAEGVSFFETGKKDETWTAEWITATFDQPPYFVRKFDVKSIEGARLYIASKGGYEIYCNGKRVSEDYLDPGFYSFDLWQQSQTYDISHYLTQGENTIVVSMGNSWYGSRMSWFADANFSYGDRLMFACEIHVDKEIIVSDSHWHCMQSPVVSTDIYDGEIFDARLEIADFANIVVNDAFVPAKVVLCNVKISDRIRPPVKKHEVLEGVIITTPKDELVIDFGQNITGWVEGDLLLQSGDSITLQYGEILQNGCFYNANLRTAKAEYSYISNGDTQHFRPRFTFFGFRYVKVSGAVNVQDLKSFRAYALYTDMDITGCIATGNELVNKLISNILWGQKGNFLDLPTDCPQRDERLGWTGDTQIFSPTALYNMDCCAFYAKYMKDLMLEQEQLGGGVPFVVPLIKGNRSDFILNKHSSCAWGDVATVLPWNIYRYYGDIKLLEKHYPAMTGWVNYIKSVDDKSDSKRLWQTGFHFADWLALDNFRKPGASFGGTDEYFVASVWYAHSALLTAKAAGVLGKKSDEQYYLNLHNEIKEAIKKEYFTPSGRCAISTQTAKVLSLQLNIVEGKGKERVAKDLAEQLRLNDMKLETGFCGTPFLCSALTDNDYTEDAYNLFLREELPGWLYEVKMGATTVWERWDSVLPDGSMNPLGMNSLNHYAYGAVKEWLYRYVAGIKLHEDIFGCKSMIIKPLPDRRLGKVNCSYNSPSGEYSSSWEYVGNSIKYDIIVPFDATAYVTLTDNVERVLPSGEYSFTIEIKDRCDMFK